MAEGDVLTLLPYYLNTRRLELLTGHSIPIAAQSSLGRNSEERVRAMRYGAHIANSLLRSGTVPNLTKQALENGANAGRVFAWEWGVFSFRGLSASILREQEGKTPKPGKLSGAITLGEVEYSVTGSLFNEHLYSQSAPTALSGRHRMFIAGIFEFDGAHVEIVPVIIGDMVHAASQRIPIELSHAASVRVYSDQIDAFRADTGKVTADDLRCLQTMPEETVKQAFASIIGEPFVPKDWGGEKSDLSTNHLKVHGQQFSAAFIFKGPSVSGELHPAGMGKRGDQLIRAFDEPVDIIVIQHCHKIANSVVRMAEAFACTPHKPRRYCILDGADTARILKQNQMLKGRLAR